MLCSRQQVNNVSETSCEPSLTAGDPTGWEWLGLGYSWLHIHLLFTSRGAGEERSFLIGETVQGHSCLQGPEMTSYRSLVLSAE